MASPQKKGSQGISWALIIVLFVFGIWPIALVLLFLKLFGKDGQKNQEEAPPLSAQAAARRSSGQKNVRAAGRAVTKSPAVKKSNAKWLKIGGVLLLLGGLATGWDAVDMMIWLGKVESYYLEDLLTGLALAVAGGAMIGSGVSMSRALKRYPQYLSVMGDREAVSIEELSRTLGFPQERVEKDLRKMIERNYFGGKAYINMELGYLLRSGKADAELKKQQAEAKAQKKQAETPREAETGYSGVLREIRRANDEIADPVLSAKIDRLEAIAAQIFRIVEAEPAKAERITTFFNYYLPTTQKLLDSYAKFESAGVEGENLRQAKARIESTMDMIVKGFEHQLDELYKSDALDVDRDIRVMETMLGRDTASVEEDFGLGGAAAQKKEKQE